jgi:hypothetical protein
MVQGTAGVCAPSRGVHVAASDAAADTAGHRACLVTAATAGVNVVAAAIPV